MSDPKDYTVGWISAVSTEYVAAQAFLDERHEPPESVSRNDNNNYTLGRIGKHNVVVAVLPDGEYGLTTAAGVARDMVHSFPNIRIGLMVGIAGGAPSKKHDIRLGDIVVGVPRDGEGGVFQFDFGKTVQNQAFEYTRFLDQPPTVLRAAVSGVQAQYEISGYDIENAINTILRNYPRLKQKYKRPNLDRLYKAGVTHPSEGEAKLASCAEVCVDESSLIYRPERAEDEDNPAIHYGLIASSNQLMKDAVVRDRLVEKKDVLCFEMEAAGLVNHFPCLIVRGICDYSDTHKNKEWQGYAAMAAAAYAKDLLSQIHPNKVESEKRLSEILSSVHDIVSTTGTNVEMMISKLDREEDLDILMWLTPIDYATQQSDYTSRRQPGTGQWLLDSAEYQEWLQSPGKTLFCPGIPGAGKTILTAIVIDDIYSRFQCDTSVGIAYLYCDFRRQHEQSVESLLANLLKQLTQKRASIPDHVQTLYKEYKGKPNRPSRNDISSALYSVSGLYSNVFIIMDALDECQVIGGCCKQLLVEVFGLQARVGANVFSTSRFNPEIEEEFKKGISVEIRARDEDVQTYLAGNMTRLPSFVLSNPDLQNKVKATISRAVDGMFLLAQLHIDYLAQEPTVGDIELALLNLPIGLDETYKQAMRRIENQGEKRERLAKNVLSWAVYSKRILSTSELQHAVAVQSGKPDLDGKFIPSVGIIGSICAGLITIDTQSDLVRLVHYTTQEYLQRTEEDWFPEAETYITMTCLTYLSFQTFESGLCQTVAEFRDRLQLNPLYNYAALNWGHHARKASLEVQQSILDFLWRQAKVSASIQALVYSRILGKDFHTQSAPRQMIGVHLAAYFGLTGVVRILLQNRDHPNVMDGWGLTPLSWAAKYGHEDSVKLLLEKGAELNSKEIDHFGRTPLSWAAGNGHEGVVKLLLEKGTELDSKENDYYGQTPLSWAAENGHEGVVKLLLEKGVEPNFKANDYYYGRTPLSWAAENGHKGVVKLLLEKGAELDPNDDGRTPLSWAAENGHEGVVKLLLKEGAEVESKDKRSGQTPLFYSAKSGHEAVVELLLEKGAQVDSKDRIGKTPLSWAAKYGHDVVIKLLLDRGAQVESKDTSNRTPLFWAVGEGREVVVKLLLERGAEVESKDNRNGQTLLSLAVQCEHEAIVKLLLEKGAEVETRLDRYGNTPLSWAAEMGHEGMVKLLLEKGAELESRNNDGQKPLSLATENGNRAVVKLLLERGAEVESKDNRNGQTLLSLAAQCEHEAIVKLLLEKGAEVETRLDRYGNTPLSWAARRGHEAVVRVLLKKGAELEAKDVSGKTPLLLAAEAGYEAVAELLLEKGADVGSKDTSGNTPLLHAARNGYKRTVKLLLDNGANLHSKNEWGETWLELLIESDKELEMGSKMLLLSAAEDEQKLVARVLLEEGAELESRDDADQTPLLWAVKGACESHIRLIQLGKRKYRDGAWAMMDRTRNEKDAYEAVIELLLNKGAEVESKDASGKTPLDWAVEHEYGEMVELVTSYI